MPNDYFQFKEFRINQGNCAMKVGTDGVLLGAWAKHTQTATILDIGTGTGLVTLMLAQRFTNATIDALEIDEEAAKQALENFKESKWNNRINIYQTSVQNFNAEKKYDLVVCNPPYFQNSFKNQASNKTIARHTDELSFEDLLKYSNLTLNEKGAFCVILPFESKDVFCSLANSQNLYLSEIVHVRPSLDKEYKRVLMKFEKQKSDLKSSEIIIEEFGRHQYSKEFIELTKDFYLKM